MNIFCNLNENKSIKNNTMSCPYNGFDICLASLSSMKIDNLRKEPCHSENFDECPIFLAKILRR